MPNRYFRGQGTIEVDGRDVGNCPELMIETNQEFFEHKESQTGNRFVDLRVQTGTTVNITMTLEDTSKENWMLALQGTAATATGTDTISAFKGVRADHEIVFNGLNTVEGNSPVVITFFKVSLDTAQSLSLISDDLVSFQLRGTVLYDSTQSALGGFFTVAQATPV